jgi:S-phase kinase-associated protein 1
MEGTLKLIASDTEEGSFIEIRRGTAMMSDLIKTMITDDKNTTVPLLEVTHVILLEVVEFMKFHENNPVKTFELPIKTNKIEDHADDWDVLFVNGMDQDTLISVLLAANYLELKPLKDLMMCKLACMIKGKEVEEIKVLFNIKPALVSGLPFSL